MLLAGAMSAAALQPTDKGATGYLYKWGDFYADEFNYHLNQGLKSGITLATELPVYAYGTDIFTLQDTINEGETAGYMFEGYTIVDSAHIDTAVAWLHEGIKDCPNRLDLYLGLATCHLYCLEIERMMDVLEQIMKQEKKNKGKWRWTGEEKLEFGEDIVYDRIQEDYTRFVEAEMLDEAEQLARLAMKYYPQRSEYVNDLAGVYYYRNQYEEAMKLFKKALKLSPKDELIQANIEILERAIHEQKQ